MEEPIQHLLKNLDYGTVYVFTPSRRDQWQGLVTKLVYPFVLKVVYTSEVKNLYLVARRFNVGNMGREATVQLRVDREVENMPLDGAINTFNKWLKDVMDDTPGDVVINARDVLPEYMRSKLSRKDSFAVEAQQDHTKVKRSKRRNMKLGGLLDMFRNRDSREVTDFEQYLEVDEDANQSPIGVSDDMVLCEMQATLPKAKYKREDDLKVEDDDELRKIEKEREAALESIRRAVISYVARFHDDPQQLMEELLRGKVVLGQPGRVIVNGDMKVVLPEYDEMEIAMPAMCRTLYILFMKLRKEGKKGILLRDIGDYRDELINIYGLVKPGANEDRVKTTVDNLCDPFSNTLNETLSRINRCIKNVVTNKEMAKPYCIKGRKGQCYSIALSPDDMELPRAVTA